MSHEQIISVLEWSGCHPYLTQQTLNVIFDGYHQASRSNLIDKLLQHHDNDFSAWWNAEQQSGSFGETEQTVYHSLVQHRNGTPKTLAQSTGLSRVKVADAHLSHCWHWCDSPVG